MPKSNFVINNKAESDVATIDIMGEIGESWFDDDETTMNTIRNEFKEINKPIILNISSLGGSANHAFVIHDIIKSHKFNTTSKILGLTASAGTIIAGAAKNREISENAMFLPHYAWTITVGNANELRKEATELDKFDGIVVDMYKKNTGKSKAEIKELMERESWMTAKEAKEWGFVDTINIAKNAISNKIYNKINDSNLPNIKSNTMNFWDKVKAAFDFSNEETAIEEITAFKTDKETLTTEVGTLKAEVITEKGKYTALKTDTDKKITDFDAEKIVEAKKLTDLQAKFEEMEGAYNSLKANPHQSQAAADPDFDDDNKNPKIAKIITSVFTDDQKRQLKNNIKK